MAVKIVVTGGPCAGKTTALSRIQEEFEKQGYKVLFVAETATELITGNVVGNCSSLEFEKALVRLQLAKESVYEQAADTMDGKVLIVCDRGIMDNSAYMSAEAFSRILTENCMTEVEARDGYDAVFHLVTAANGAEEFYTTANNAARTETPEQARAIDEKLIAAWTGHPHLRVIDNSTDFDGKIHRLLTEIAGFLGEPEPREIERKFLIEYPDLDWLESLPNCGRVEIIQTYLNDASGSETRVRQRGADGSFSYYKTTKKQLTDRTRVEIESRLSRDEYLSLLMDADTSRHPIRKTRYCLTWDAQYFEIDVYPFWTDRAIVEIELSSEDDPIRFPPQLHIVREVTEDAAYRNSSLAKEVPHD